MNPKNFIKPADMFKKWSLPQLWEYYYVQIQLKEERRDDEFEVRRIENLIEVVYCEIMQRGD